MQDNSKSRWSDAEFEAAVQAYFEMLNLQETGQAYSKSAVNQRLRDGPLVGRTKASVEYRMQNISAVLDLLGRPWLRGYTPAKNVGSGATAIIERLIVLHGDGIAPHLQPTADALQLEARTSTVRRLGLGSVPKGQENVRQERQVIDVYIRDPHVRAWVLNEANGMCGGCLQSAPFITAKGEPFLEVHHVKWLVEGGTDRVENAIALCPNCHRRCHLSSDRMEFSDSLYRRHARLIRE